LIRRGSAVLVCLWHGDRFREKVSKITVRALYFYFKPAEKVTVKRGASKNKMKKKYLKTFGSTEKSNVNYICLECGMKETYLIHLDLLVIIVVERCIQSTIRTPKVLNTKSKIIKKK
jgi:hypothetical protein